MDVFCLQHAFFQSDMSKRLALELLQKVNNPSHMFSDLEADEDGVSSLTPCCSLKITLRLELVLQNFLPFQAVPNVPQRIASRHTARAKRRLPSQLGGGLYDLRHFFVIMVV